MARRRFPRKTSHPLFGVLSELTDFTQYSFGRMPRRRRRRSLRGRERRSAPGLEGHVGRPPRAPEEVGRRIADGWSRRSRSTRCREWHRPHRARRRSAHRAPQSVQHIAGAPSFSERVSRRSIYYCGFGGVAFETCIAICHEPASLTAVTPACPLGPLGNMKSR